MKNFSSLKELPHFPVMLNEVLKICEPEKGGKFIDCTFGSGGYSNSILSYPQTSVFAFDRDPHVRKYANLTEKRFKTRFNFSNKKFSEISSVIPEETKVDCIIFDLGLSSLQILNLERGFSFKSKFALDMRMGLNTISAKDVLNNFDLKTLNSIIKILGEEKDSYNISKNIIRARKICPINNVSQLVDIIKNSKKNNFKKKIDICTKTFQAIRIFVNKEISELINGLITITQFLKTGGKIIVVSFHSLEDRKVKHAFMNDPRLDRITKKPLIAAAEETLINPRSRSAKYRIASERDALKGRISRYQ